MFLVSRSFEFDYRRQSFLALPVLPNWKLLVRNLFDVINSNRVTVSRSREITSTTTQTQPPPTFASDQPSLDITTEKIQMASTISEWSIDLVTSAEMWYGVAYKDGSIDTVYWFGQTLAVLNGAEVSGSWDRHVLSVSVGTTSCAVTSYRMNARKLRFNVRFKVSMLQITGVLHRRGASLHPGSPVFCALAFSLSVFPQATGASATGEAAFGEYSIDTGTWTLYRKQVSGTSQLLDTVLTLCGWFSSHLVSAAGGLRYIRNRSVGARGDTGVDGDARRKRAERSGRALLSHHPILANQSPQEEIAGSYPIVLRATRVQRAFYRF